MTLFSKWKIATDYVHYGNDSRETRIITKLKQSRVIEGKSGRWCVEFTGWEFQLKLDRDHLFKAQD